MKFNPGKVVVTRCVNDLIADNVDFSKHVNMSLHRHVHGDWGDLCDDDRELNEVALQQGMRIFSVYEKEVLPTIWIITEWNRSVTTVLLPEEY